MTPKPKQSLAAARWILGVGLALFGAAIVLVKILDAPPSSEQQQDATKAGKASSASAPTARPGADDVPPWEAAKRQQKQELPRGAVPASEIDPPPPDRNASVPPLPIEPPNPATNRP